MDRRRTLVGQASRLGWTAVVVIETIEAYLAGSPSKLRRSFPYRWKTVQRDKEYLPSKRRISVRHE
jgi:hypothetical protein